MTQHESKRQLKLPGLGQRRDFEGGFNFCEGMMLKGKCRYFRPAQFPSSRPQDKFNGYCQFWITAWGNSKEQRKIRNRQEANIQDVDRCPLKRNQAA